MDEKNTNVPQELEEQETAGGVPKIRTVTAIIVVTITLFACLCAVLVGLFSPALRLSLQGSRLSMQKRYTEASVAYGKIPPMMSELQKKLPDTIDLESLYGIEYHLLKAYGGMSKLQLGGEISGNFPESRLKKFPLSKFRPYAEEYNEYQTMLQDIQQVLAQYINKTEDGYENVKKAPVFDAIDKFAATHPKAPAWGFAILRSYVGELVDEDNQTRIAYFDEALKSDDGIDEYGKYLIPIYNRLKDTDSILSIYERRFKLNHNDNDALVGIGKLQLAAGNLKAAQNTLKKARKYTGKSGAPETIELEILRRAKKYDDAVKLYIDYRDAQDAKESAAFYEATRQYAIVLLLQNDYQSAEEMAYEAITSQPEAGGDYAEQAYYLLSLTAALAQDTEIIEQYGLEQNEAGKAILAATDKKAAIEKLFLEGKGDIA
ncbi:MAG: hypothetical protein LBJ12_06625 [Oscillospiraceae bacterium]|jgi:tetratricopeptide (TPR) repeat protein|nr:hypothetical protein [Oscillospiraceae bacterium]